MRSWLGIPAACFAGLSLESGTVFGQDQQKVRVPLAIYTGEGLLDRGKTSERDRSNRCDTRSDLTITLYDGGKVQYRSIGQSDPLARQPAEGDLKPDKSFVLARKANNRTFDMTGRVSADQGRVSGTWSVQVRQGSGLSANTCVYAFDLLRLQ